MSGTKTDGIEVIPMDAPLGAEIRGVDLAAGVTPGQIEAINAAWEQYLVLLLRDQTIEDPHLIAYSRQFGDLDMPNSAYAGNMLSHDYPEVNIISNIVEGGRSVGKLGDGEAVWHADMTYNDMPPKAAILYSIEIPDSGGTTCFADMYAAYDALSDDLKKRIEGQRAIHDAAHNSAGQRRKGYEAITDARETPGARQPMVRTHPRTGRKCLFLGRRPNSYILGLDLAESDELLDAVWAAATREQFVVCHDWRVGDVLMWDNLSVLHRRDSFPPESRRMMHRTQITGTEAIA
jgi:taurine dioxygenase